MPRVEAPANSGILHWAREFMGYQPHEVAHKLHTAVEKVIAWERGEARPTLRQLEKLSDVYRQPLVTFFRDEPPEAPQWPADYRRFPKGKRRPLSPRTRAAIWEARWRQSVAADLRRELAVSHEPPVHGLTMPSDPEEAGEQVRARIGPDVAAQERWTREPYLLFRNWRRIVESIGVLVFRLDFPKEDARGFSLPHPVAPVVAVSSKDYRSATLFSTFHELAHLILHVSGACNDLEFRRSPRSDRERVEVRSNHFAGAFLVPRDRLLSHPLVQGHRGDWDDDGLTELARSFGVSREVVLRRLVILGRASSQFYDQWRKRQQEAWQDRQEKSRGFAVPLAHARKRINQQGESYVRLVLDAYSSKVINLSETSEYLNVKTRHIHDMEMVLETGGHE